MFALPSVRSASLILGLCCGWPALGQESSPPQEQTVVRIPSPTATPSRSAVPQASDTEVPEGAPLGRPGERLEARMLQQLNPSSSLSMIKAGLGVFISAYATAYLTGTLIFAFELQGRQDRSSYPGSSTSSNVIDSTSGVGDVLGGSGALWIPVAGPLISAIVYRQPAWSLPIALIDGSAQITGLILMVVGARMQAVSKSLPSRALLLPQLTSAGGRLVVSGQF